MVSTNTICKEILNVKNAVIEDCIFFNDADGVKHIRIKARPKLTLELLTDFFQYFHLHIFAFFKLCNSAVTKADLFLEILPLHVVVNH